MTRYRIIGFLCAVWLLMLAPSHSQDRAAVVPDMKVHWHPAYVAYVFNAYTAKAILPDGKEILLSRKTGDVFYSGPVTHRIANTGTTPIHNLIVELKEVNPQ